MKLSCVIGILRRIINVLLHWIILAIARLLINFHSFFFPNHDFYPFSRNSLGAISPVTFNYWSKDPMTWYFFKLLKETRNKKVSRLFWFPIDKAIEDPRWKIVPACALHFRPQFHFTNWKYWLENNKVPPQWLIPLLVCRGQQQQSSGALLEVSFLFLAHLFSLRTVSWGAWK